jgi:aromatic ring-opening dioxygenase LigB subunit
MILKPDEDEILHLREIQLVHDACLELAHQIRERRPQTIVLVTPHGVTVEQGVTGVYMNAWARGSAEWSGGFSQIHVQCELDVLASRGLLKMLKEAGCKARGIEFFGGGRSAAQLGWAEVVPLWFLDDILGFSRFVVVSQSVAEGFAFGEMHSMSRSEAQSMLSSVTEMMKVGQALSDWADGAENKDTRIFMLFSAALSHSHGGHGGRLNRNRHLLDDGSWEPEQLLSPRFLSMRTLEMRNRDSDEHDTAAQLYDQAVEFWLRTLRAEGLIVTARKAVPLAQPCSYSILVILNGVLDGRNHEIWMKNILVRCVPTNFGMCVSSLLPRWDRLPREVMDTHAAHLVLDAGEEYQLMTIKCWFNDFGDFLDVHGQIVVLPDLPRTPSPIPPPASETESQIGSPAPASSKLGSDQASPSPISGKPGTGKASNRASAQPSATGTGNGSRGAGRKGMKEDMEEGEEEEEAQVDPWDSMIEEENKQNVEQEARIAWLEEQERLKRMKQTTPPYVPTRAERQIGIVEDILPGRVLVVFAETLSHLHEQAVLAARAGCVAIIVVGVGDAKFTLEEYKVVGTSRKANSRITTGKSRKSGGGSNRVTSRNTGQVAQSSRPHTQASQPPPRPGTGATRAGTGATRPGTGASSGNRMRYGRVDEHGQVADTGEGEDTGGEGVVFVDSKTMRGSVAEQTSFFRVPIPVVWVSPSDAAYMADGCMVSIYWYGGLMPEGEPQPVAKPDSIVGLAAIQKRLLETDPDLHAKQISSLHLEIKAQEVALREKARENQALEERLSSALRELRDAKEAHRNDLNRHEQTFGKHFTCFTGTEVQILTLSGT